jgi:putative oxidoreductase
MLNTGLLILRIVLGLTFVGHGGQKLFGWFGGPGIQAWLGIMQKSRVRPPWFWGWIAALSEFVGGILVTLGFLSPLGSLAIIAVMLVAIVQVHWPKGFWNTKGGYEFDLANIAAALALALAGPGAFSLDAIFHVALPEPAVLLVGLVVVILGVILQQASRLPAPAQTPETGGQARHPS